MLAYMRAVITPRIEVTSPAMAKPFPPIVPLLAFIWRIDFILRNNAIGKTPMSPNINEATASPEVLGVDGE